ncbi:hypothetical protein [Streptomyces griseiscabiei]|uniref:Uncharacterized protein n=1 Tax=Streptomyces griseiscabiei TaxID=2993540 RepID=A0ABU4KYP9_9ACTN|nr:hypothetical protein [Streptomyces griseiscabiei]MBZ3904743.1 hypothetical protein [Streptomyces griseiscabiei]MDX2908491.1 hypothetical protein [Streptomyces griseiscabiei]
MNDDRLSAYAAEAVIWSGLAALLPGPEDVDLVQGCWDIGEQEAGLGALVERLSEARLPVDGTARTRIAVLAEVWDVWDRHGAEIAGLAEEPGRPARLRVLADGAEGTVPAGEVLAEPPSPTSELVPWIVCPPCGRTLARSHRREEWTGGLWYIAEAYVVFARDRAVTPLVFDAERDGAAWSALEALHGACACG